MKEEFVKRNSIKKYLDYIIEQSLLGLKTIKEYKTNSYLMILLDVVTFGVMMLTYMILMRTLPGIFIWDLYDFFLFYGITLMLWKLMWMHTLRQFNNTLLSGELNIYRTKPFNVYFLTSSKWINVSFANQISNIFLYGIIIVIFLTQEYNNLILVHILLIIGLIYFVTFFTFINSMFFFMKRNDFGHFLHTIEGILYDFTPRIFENMKLGNILLLFPAAISSYFIIEVANNRFNLYLHYLPYALLVFLTLLSSIVVLWHYGLKKYEAFG
ncbi:MAG: hypothetical protein VXZ40_00505 [Nanoarchaeota archaeon]|nr:hypothetical protein [Nanoarchaeota archaeon]